MARVFTVKTALSDYFQGALGETKLREELRKGNIPHVRVGTRIIIREDALDAWMVKQEKISTTKGKFPYQLARKNA